MISDVNKDEIGRLIKQQRIFSELTRAQLGKKAGLSPSVICRVERGERFPTARTLHKLAKVLDISEVELFIRADYLSKPESNKKIEEETQIMKLDPGVIFELSKESLKTQRTVLTLLKMLRSIATDIASEKTEDRS